MQRERDKEKTNNVEEQEKEKDLREGKVRKERSEGIKEQTRELKGMRRKRKESEQKK